ncbi:MAG TPA: transglutaminase domain-containing protein [Hanamia sp.]
MRFMIIIVSFLCYAVIVKAQQGNTYYDYKIIKNIPDSQTQTTSGIASYIKSNFSTDDKKIRAIYVWVTSNIKYDRDSIHRVILDEDNEERVTYALKRRRGVCENFAAIFNDICTKSGINSYVIEGYSRQDGYIDRSPHVWCTAFVDNKWAFYDPTWDAGFISTDNFVSQVQMNYFQISPEDFIQTHLPFDPLFQFLNYPVSYKEFSKDSKPTKTSNSYFDFQDSLNVYIKSDSLSRYLSSLSRIENYDWPSSKIDTKLKRTKLEIELIYQDRDMSLYHGAIADYNDGISILNNFITYRNNQFQPVKTNDEIQKMFYSILQKINSANQKLIEVNKSTATLTLDTGDIKKKLDDLVTNAKEEEIFYKNYLISVKEK